MFEVIGFEMCCIKFLEIDVAEPAFIPKSSPWADILLTRLRCELYSFCVSDASIFYSCKASSVFKLFWVV